MQKEAIITFTSILEIIQVFVTIFGAILGAFFGSYYSAKLTDRRRARIKHFKDLKEVLFEWNEEVGKVYIELERLHGFPDKPATMPDRTLKVEGGVLFSDIEKHFPELISDWRDFKKNYQEYCVRVESFYNDVLNQTQNKMKLTVSGEGDERISYIFPSHAYYCILKNSGLEHYFSQPERDEGDYSNYHMQISPEELKTGKATGGDHYETYVEMSGFKVVYFRSKDTHKHDKIRECYREITTDHTNILKASKIIMEAKTLYDKREEAKRELKRISLLNKLPGKCIFIEV